MFCMWSGPCRLCLPVRLVVTCSSSALHMGHLLPSVGIPQLSSYPDFFLIQELWVQYSHYSLNVSKLESNQSVRNVAV